jgi:hypothetical protein
MSPQKNPEPTDIKDFEPQVPPPDESVFLDTALRPIALGDYIGQKNIKIIFIFSLLPPKNAKLCLNIFFFMVRLDLARQHSLILSPKK